MSFRVVHYLNQFFANVGGEEMAHIPAELREGKIGPGLAFETAWKGEAVVVNTIVCGDSGLADALSTALFLLPQAEGQALLDVCGAEALWGDHQGNLLYSPGFQAIIRT